VLLGLAKLVAAAAMWEGREWGGYLLAGTVALLLPFDVRQAVASLMVGHILLAAANAAVLVVLVLLLRGRLPGWRAGAQQARPRRLARCRRGGSRPPWPARWRTAGR
jgi:uncharacterized membrane protein (DUF2068 family)